MLGKRRSQSRTWSLLPRVPQTCLVTFDSQLSSLCLQAPSVQRVGCSLCLVMNRAGPLSCEEADSHQKTTFLYHFGICSGVRRQQSSSFSVPPAQHQNAYSGTYINDTEEMQNKERNQAWVRAGFSLCEGPAFSKSRQAIAGTSLMVQGLRIHLPRQGIWVPFLIRN